MANKPSLTSTLNLGVGSASDVCSVMGGVLLGIGPVRTYSHSGSFNSSVNCSKSGNVYTINCSTSNYFIAPASSSYTYKVPSSGTYALTVTRVDDPPTSPFKILTNFTTCDTHSGTSDDFYKISGKKSFVLSGGGSFTSASGGYICGAICKLS